MLGPIVADFDRLTEEFKRDMGAKLEDNVKKVIDRNGPSTITIEPDELRHLNPRWKPLSNITKMLKGSSKPMIDTGMLRNFVRWIIEDSEVDGLEGVLKIGWFEEAGSRVWIALVHEFGLTGTTFKLPDGSYAGGPPIGRTPIARAKIRAWYRDRLGLKVSGIVIIPERSMLRKAADMVARDLDEYFLATFKSYIINILRTGI